MLTEMALIANESHYLSKYQSFIFRVFQHYVLISRVSVSVFGLGFLPLPLDGVFFDTYSGAQ